MSINGTEHVRRVYVSPEITELGSVESMTQGPWSGWIDSILGGDGGWRPPTQGETS
jgi:hypothetical protein